MGKIMKIGSNGYRVYVVGGGYEYLQFLFELGYQGAKGIGEADFVLFTGGEDVDPSLYGEKPLSGTNFNTERDKRERMIYEECVATNTPMIGICRGGQFLNVMNGGKMWQHVENHCGNHKMDILNLNPKTSAMTPVHDTIEVTSTHHQMMIPAEDALVLAVASICTEKQSEGTIIQGIEEHKDIEVVWYDKTSTMCFQPHPEYHWSPKACKDYFDELLDNFIIPATYEKKDAA